MEEAMANPSVSQGQCESSSKQSDFEQDFVNLCEELDPASDHFQEQSQRIETMFRQADEALKTVMERGKASWNELKVVNDTLKSEIQSMKKERRDAEEKFKEELACKSHLIEVKKARNLALAAKLVQTFKKHKEEIQVLEDRNKDMESKVRERLDTRAEEIEILRKQHNDTEELVRASIEKGIAENEELRDQLSIAQLENQVLEKRLDILMKKEPHPSIPMVAHQIFKNDYESIKSELREAKQKLKEGPKDYGEEYAKLQAEHNQLIQAFEYMKAHYVRDAEEYRQALVDLEITRDDLDAALHFLEEEQNENCVLQMELDHLTASNLRAPEGFTTITMSFDRLCIENEEIKANLLILSQQADKLKVDMENVEKENAKMKVDMEDFEKENAKLKDENHDLKTNSKTLITNNEMYRKSLVTLNEEKRGLKDSVEALQNDIALKSSMLTGQQEKIKSLEQGSQKERIAELEKEVQRWKTEAKNFESEKKQSDENLVKLKEDHHVLLKEITSQGGEDMTKIIEKLKAEVAQQKAQNAEMKKTMAVAKKAWEEEVDQFYKTKPGQKIQELQKEVDTLRKDLELNIRKRKEADDSAKAARLQKGEFETEMMLSIKKVNEQEIAISELEFRLQEAMQRGDSKPKLAKEEVKPDKKENKEVETLRTLVKTLQSKVDKSEPLAEKNRKLQEDITLLEAAVRNHKTFSQQAKSNEEALQKKLDEVNLLIQARTDSVTEFTQSYEKLKKDHERVQHENVQLHNALLARNVEATRTSMYQELSSETQELKTALEYSNARLKSLEIKLAVSVAQAMCSNVCLVSAWRGQQVMPSLVFAALQKEFPTQFGEITKKIKGSKDIQVRFWRNVFGESLISKQEITTHNRIMKILDFIKSKGLTDFGPEPCKLFSETMDKNSRQVLRFMCKKCNTPTDDVHSIMRYCEVEKMSLYYFAQATTSRKVPDTAAFASSLEFADTLEKQIDLDIARNEITVDFSNIDQSKQAQMQEIFDEFGARFESLDESTVAQLDKKIDENFEEGYLALLDELEKATVKGQKNPLTMLAKSKMLTNMKGESIVKEVKQLKLENDCAKSGKVTSFNVIKPLKVDEAHKDTFDESGDVYKVDNILDPDCKVYKVDSEVCETYNIELSFKKDFFVSTKLHPEAEEFKPLATPDPKFDEDVPLLAKKPDGIKKPLAIPPAIKAKKKK